MNRIGAFAILAIVVMLTGCSSIEQIGVAYTQAYSKPEKSQHALSIAVGNFNDMRGEPSKWLGAVRGGYGQTVIAFESKEPASEVVKAAVLAGLKSHGILSDGSKKVLTGNIKRLDCNVYGRRAADAEIEMILLAENGTKLFSKTYSVSNLESLPFITGRASIINDLNAVLNRTLTEVVDKALSDTELILLMKS